MELRPTAYDISARNAYLEAQEVAERQRAIAERQQELAAEAKREREARKKRYETAWQELTEMTKPVDYLRPQGWGTELLGSWATEWVVLPSKSPDVSLVAEGRYLSLAMLNTRLDRSRQKVRTRINSAYIEVRWSDPTINYVSAPQKLIRLGEDELALYDCEREDVYSFESAVFSEQASIDDLLSTVIEPVRDSLRHQAADIEQLPLE